MFGLKIFRLSARLNGSSIPVKWSLLFTTLNFTAHSGAGVDMPIVHNLNIFKGFSEIKQESFKCRQLVVLVKGIGDLNINFLEIINVPRNQVQI